MQTRREFLATTLKASGAVVLPPVYRPQPNILFLLADDLGYNDLGCYGCADIPTPNIDSLGEHGVKCEAAYSAASVCAPSRAGIMSGCCPESVGYPWWNPTPPYDNGLDLNVTTLGDVMSRAGYETAYWGKWQLGYEDGYRPTQRGWNHFYGFLHNAPNYRVAHLRKNENSWPDRLVRQLKRGDEDISRNRYYPELITADVQRFIRHSDKPWCAYVGYKLPHLPLEATQKYLQRVQHIQDPTRRTYAAMVCALDASVGKIVQMLRTTGQLGNTLIVLTSDNGGLYGIADNFPLRDGKHWLSEGGIRVPMIAHWPVRIASGRTISTAVSHIDLLPTFASVGRAELRTTQSVDGVNILPTLTGRLQPLALENRSLFWSQAGHAVCMRDGWKYKHNYLHRFGVLFDLKNDIGETTNVIRDNLELGAELRAELAEWNEYVGGLE
jgi:arylsulfatase A-like enzyme